MDVFNLFVVSAFAMIAGASIVAKDKSRKPLFQNMPQHHVKMRPAIISWLSTSLLFGYMVGILPGLAFFIGTFIGFLLGWRFIPRRIQLK